MVLTQGDTCIAFCLLVIERIICSIFQAGNTGISGRLSRGNISCLSSKIRSFFRPTLNKKVYLFRNTLATRTAVCLLELIEKLFHSLRQRRSKCWPNLCLKDTISQFSPNPCCVTAALGQSELRPRATGQ